jgi:hypothetical protein
MVESYKFDWAPDEWQDFGLQLIRERHGGSNVQRVPDEDRGDAGLEAFTFDGCTYQCYAPEFTPDISFRATKIRAKLNRDVKKLARNKGTVAKLLGSLKASRWILLVPLFDSKEVISTCSDLTDYIISQSLAFINSDFRVCVEDQADFSSEIEQLRRRGSMRVRVSMPITPHEVLEDWQIQNIDLVEEMRKKLKRAFPSDSDTQTGEKVAQYITWHLGRDNVLDQLRRDVPDVWEAVVVAASNAEKKLKTFGRPNGNAREAIGNCVEGLSNEINECMPSFQRSAVDELAIGTVADWLMRCPLDF